MTKWAKIFLIAILVVIIAGGIIWYFRQRSTQEPVTQPADQGNIQQEVWQPISRHPWPMFHGNYNHTGYANVSGPSSANVKWKVEIGGQEGNKPNSVVVSNDGTIYVNGNNKIWAFNKEGKEKWLKSNYRSSQGPALDEQGNIYFVSDRRIIAIEKTGKEKWSFETKGNTIFGPTVGPDGTIYQGSWDGNFYAVNQDGSLKWKYKTEGSVSYPSSIDRNGTIYLGGGDAHSGPDKYLYAFNEDGTLKWKYDTQTMRVGSPAIGIDDFILAPASPALFALKSNGDLAWRKGPEGDFSGNKEVEEGIVEEKEIFEQPPNNQQPPPQDEEREKETSGIISPAVSLDGTIYIGNSDGVLSAIDPKTQEIKWTFQTGPDPKDNNFYGLIGFPLVDKEGTVYVGAVDGKMYAIDKNGKEKWSFQTGGRITEASPAFDEEGTLYFTSDDGFLYALGN